MTQIVTLIIENGKGEILMYLRDNKPEIPFPHYWDLFGGEIEAGETPQEALKRELKEELGITLANCKFFKKYDCLEGDVKPNIKYVYSVKTNQPLEEMTLLEGEELRFFSREEIGGLKAANILKSIILDYFNAKNLS